MELFKFDNASEMFNNKEITNTVYVNNDDENNNRQDLKFAFQPSIIDNSFQDSFFKPENKDSVYFNNQMSKIEEDKKESKFDKEMFSLLDSKINLQRL